jgi:hypothetical protein
MKINYLDISHDDHICISEILFREENGEIDTFCVKLLDGGLPADALVSLLLNAAQEMGCDCDVPLEWLCEAFQSRADGIRVVVEEG